MLFDPRRLPRRFRPSGVSDAISGLRAAIADWLPVAPNRAFGPVEAIRYGGRLDVWERYLAVIEAIERAADVSRPLRIVEVGSGGRGLLDWAAYAPWIRSAEVWLIDLGPDHLPRGYPRAVAGSGVAIPGRDHAFDVAVSVASLEHVESEPRRAYAAELARVADLVVVYVPAETADGMFRGRAGDQAFQDWFVNRFGHPEANTAEHLATSRHPDPAALFPGADVRGCQSLDRWLATMQADSSPWRRHLAGFGYWRAGRPEPRPPYYSAIVSYRAAR